MNCPICKADITESVKQFGDIHLPICQSCYLSGNDWVYDDPEILKLLASDVSLEDAMAIENERENKELTRSFFEIMHELSCICGAHDG
jgi:hypothetical protein